MNKNVVIIGAGQAGVTAAITLRDLGWKGGIHLVGDENTSPYQRPPLSKGYLAGSEVASDLVLASDQLLQQKKITTLFGVQAEGIHRRNKLVELSDGSMLAYQWLILATGSTPRKLDIPGKDLPGIFTIRNVGDAVRLRASFGEGGDTVLIGGGFLNLEIAAEALKHGAVTVLETAPQILGRALSLPSAHRLREFHEALGVRIQFGVEIDRFVGIDGNLRGIGLADGTEINAARIVVSVGAAARDELAAAAGLETSNGIVVDENLRTSDNRIFAIGDCALYPNAFSEVSMRVESVQNATDQARYVASLLTGARESDYRAVPWFWSTQGDRRLQIAGLALPGDDTKIVVDDVERGKFVVERYRRGALVAVESINSPGAHMKARKMLSKDTVESALT